MERTSVALPVVMDWWLDSHWNYSKMWFLQTLLQNSFCY